LSYIILLIYSDAVRAVKLSTGMHATAVTSSYSYNIYLNFKRGVLEFWKLRQWALLGSYPYCIPRSSFCGQASTVGYQEALVRWTSRTSQIIGMPTPTNIVGALQHLKSAAAIIIYDRTQFCFCDFSACWTCLMQGVGRARSRKRIMV
jgi:hypothetical protein